MRPFHVVKGGDEGGGQTATLSPFFPSTTHSMYLMSCTLEASTMRMTLSFAFLVSTSATGITFFVWGGVGVLGVSIFSVQDWWRAERSILLVVPLHRCNV